MISQFPVTNSFVDFFNSANQFFADVGEWLRHLVDDFVKVVEITSNAVANIGDYFVWLPAEVALLLVGSFVVVVLYMIWKG